MYADRYARPTRFNPGGLTAAVAINVALVAALMFAGPKILPNGPEHVLITDNIPIDPPPPEPPLPQPPAPAARAPVERIVAPIPPITVPTEATFTTSTTESPPVAGPLIGTDPGPATPAADPAPPLPPLVGPQIDPRYAAQFQPVYPAAERRANHDGRVTVRVLVGTDGRVKQIERVNATSDAFWQATMERATRAWRFTPATRGGVPVEAWRSLTLTFRMEDAD
ncbi:MULTISPECIES: energy transducer TonB [Sphingomonas]|uniref:Energy transducer TonB n=1 Tax=Sphingomonas kyungheensis TaxID=1069987 RepID=A0ABU8H3Y9_9SPHN|nr:energy transducer TonB [Sphingomonas sp. RIT328]EZP51027.1 TonB-like protein [Sphingomonas sp. RIT328]